MAQKTGALIFDETADRYDIRFDIADYYGGLHCGECIYNEGGKRALIENVNAALPYMDADMRELAKRTLSKVDALTEAEFAELPIYAADEV